MGILIICRDGLYSSIINNLILALFFKKSGKRVKVIFTSEALYGLCNESITFPYSLSGVEIRKTILEGLNKLGIFINSDRDPKLVDIKKLLKLVKELGINLYACPIWLTLLKLEEKLPQELTTITIDKLLEEIDVSNKIIGSL